MTPQVITVGGIPIGGTEPLVFIGGPCAIESRGHALQMADRIGDICGRVGISWIYKSSYDKDCRSSPESFHGVGLDDGLSVLQQVRDVYGVPVTTDFSDPAHARSVGAVVDMIQVPAYLCRQTRILRAAARTGKPVHVKKGQFMAPSNMANVVRKLEASGASEILLTERGTFFGYADLVNDFRGLAIMQATGYPVCYDATHSVQRPTSDGRVSGGNREFLPALVRAAVSFGVSALFMEVHDNPAKALSDPSTVLDVRLLEGVLREAKALHALRLDLSTQLTAA